MPWAPVLPASMVLLGLLTPLDTPAAAGARTGHDVQDVSARDARGQAADTSSDPCAAAWPTARRPGPQCPLAGSCWAHHRALSAGEGLQAAAARGAAPQEGGVHREAGPIVWSALSRRTTPDPEQRRPSVQATPAEAFHHQPHMGPYLFFDCARGRQDSQGGASLFNQVRPPGPRPEASDVRDQALPVLRLCARLAGLPAGA